MRQEQADILNKVYTFTSETLHKKYICIYIEKLEECFYG